MAISTETFKINAGWAKSDLITQMESAFTHLGWNAGTITGYVVGLSSFWGGGDTNASDTYHSVFQKSTSGIGTGASFYIIRDINGIRTINVNRPGVGYTSGELITISADDIGGLGNGAADLSFKVCVDETVTNGGSYGIAVTNGNNNSFNFLGADRNGTVGGGVSVVTIREGDTLSIGNSWSTSYYPQIKNPTPVVPNEATASSKGMLAGLEPSLPVSDSVDFRTKIGQAGTYYWSTNSQNNLYGTESGRLIITEWSGDPSDRTLVGYGTATEFWDKNLTNDSPWGTAKLTIQPNKRYGDAYHTFVARDTSNLDITTGSGWSFYDGGEYYGDAGNDNSDTANYHGGTLRKHRFAGAKHLDMSHWSPADSQSSPDWGSVWSTQVMRTGNVPTGGNTSFDLDLNLFKSGLDPNFVVFSYKAPTLSSADIADNTFGTWFFHKFVTDVWDLDHVFMGGMTRILFDGTATDPFITFRTYMTVKDPDNSYYHGKRAAEFGYSNYWSGQAINNYVDFSVKALSMYDNTQHETSARMYYRADDDLQRVVGGSNDTTGKDRVTAVANSNKVLKGIPLNGLLLPVPYYIPDDFVLIQFHYSAPAANIQQGDTVTISGSEVYTVICGSYNQTDATRGILFCARTT